MNTMPNTNVIFPKGEKASADYFTGTARVHILVQQDETGNYAVGNVVFEPGCRNNWHTHPAGQILLVTDGNGFYQEKGKPARMLTKGDVVVIPSSVEHWHGAAHDSSFTHIVITNNTSQGAVTWLAPVSDAEYNSVQSAHHFEEDSVSLTETAIRNHEEIFPNHKSTLKKTDPELIKVFDNFAFDEVIRYDTLGTKTRLMAIVASTIASQALTEFKVMAGAALNAGVTPVELKEIVYQAVPYIGIAKVFDFLHAVNDVLQSRGIQLPLEKQSLTNADTRYEQGLKLQKEIFGDMIEKLHSESPEDLLHIQKFLSSNCFGDYLTRTGLDIQKRELLTFAMLISLGSAESQVKAHIRGNVNVGNDRAVLVSVITQLLPYIGYPLSLNALQCINEILPHE
ncbi:MAG: carboxymuconolactone decarboxylase family protein [Bacteroidota bacterium]|nr:carboxymuconolactone decarboxylase family protein [Bacteroidota bacterium]